MEGRRDGDFCLRGGGGGGEVVFEGFGGTEGEEGGLVGGAEFGEGVDLLLEFFNPGFVR